VSHAPSLRPYRLPAAMEEGEWIDQITLVFNLVHALSNFGELTLSSVGLRPEVEFLSNAANMDKALELGDVHVVSCADPRSAHACALTAPCRWASSCTVCASLASRPPP
jgi:hypothetical protein